MVKKVMAQKASLNLKILPKPKKKNNMRLILVGVVSSFLFLGDDAMMKVEAKEKRRKLKGRYNCLRTRAKQKRRQRI